MKTQKKWILITAAILLCIAAVLTALFCLNQYSMELNIPDKTITLEYGVDELPEVTAFFRGSLINREETPVQTTMQGNVNLKKLGTYHVTYTAEYKKRTFSEEKTIIVADTVPPVIELVSDPEHFTSPVATYEEEGYTATDNYDGDLTANVIREEHDGVITYTVKDSSGNETSVDRTIFYKDVVLPTITLKGEARSYVKVGETYSEPGFSASDDVDGDLTAKVQVSGSVDTSKMGKNTLTYTVTDAAGNMATTTRSIFVYQKQAVSNPVNPGDKVVYLTFDDGPGKYTGALLDILDKYGVKATFFVTNQFPAYQNMIGETYRRGHTVALHTYSHRYENIYKSEDAYYSDLEQMNHVCINQTGVAPTIVRFPGGTNNKVSRKYCNGIMTALTQSISYHGYFYCDWNVSSGDAGGTNTASGVFNNVIAGIQKQNVSVVLQHDIKGFSVEAVDEILFWGLEHGYTFLPLTESSPMVHYAPQN